MPPVRVLIVDDLVLRAEVLALGLDASPDIVVVGRLRHSDNSLGPRSAAAPADVALVSLPPGSEPARADQRAGAPGVRAGASAPPRWLSELTADLSRNRPELRLVALVDPYQAELIEILERTGVWLCMQTTASLADLISFLVAVAAAQ